MSAPKDRPATAREIYAACNMLVTAHLLRKSLPTAGELHENILDALAVYMKRPGRAEAARGLPGIVDALVTARLARMLAHYEASLEDDRLEEGASTPEGA